MFGIQQAAIVVESAPDVDAGRRFGARVDLQFGQATETVQGGAANEPRPDVYRHIWQAYGTYVFPVGRGLQTDFGKFASMLGYETNYAKDNNNFSRAYLFNFLPFYHSGLRVSLPVSDKVTVMYMLTNGIQQTEDFNDFKSNHFAAIVKPRAQARPGRSTTTSARSSPTAASRDGPDGFFRVFDTYVAYTRDRRAQLGLDVNYVTNEVNKADDPRCRCRASASTARYQLTHACRAGRALRAARRRGPVRRHRSGAAGDDRDPRIQVRRRLPACAASSAATGRTRRSSPVAGPATCATTRTPPSIGLVWWFGNKTGAW